MSIAYGQPPPPLFATSNGGATYGDDDMNANVIGGGAASSSSTSVSSSIVIVIIIVSSAVIVSASIYILLRFLSRRNYAAAADDVVVPRNSSEEETSAHSNDCSVSSENAVIVETLPLFTFGSVTGNLTGGDCAVCLSKFEPHDQLRLLPLCCHAFHARCIDTWISNNQTCPLCRSTVYPTDADVLNKIHSISNSDDHQRRNGGSENNSNGSSFRIEIGSISRRHGLPDTAVDAASDSRRSYSIGSFDYIVDGDGYEVQVDSIHRRAMSERPSVDKESSPEESLAAEVGGGRNWLRDYVDRLSSRAMSFRSSGRFFTGSSRRSDVVVPIDDDLEANRIGEEISELFRWFSGV